MPNVESVCFRRLRVDNTLNIPGAPVNGPIDLRDVAYLKNEGNIVGICGDYYVAFKRWKDWHRYLNFWGPLASHDKARFLGIIKMDIYRTQPMFNDFVMVGNTRADAIRGLVLPPSNDDGYARVAGWRFIKEVDFASGKR